MITRAAQPYVGIRTDETMQTMSTAMPRFLPKLFSWLAAKHMRPAGPPFVRYWVIDMAHKLQVEVGVPTARRVAVSGLMHPGVLPAGRYADVIATGLNLVAANAELQKWAKAQGLTLQTTLTPQGTRWACRVEFSLSNPAKVPDSSKWKTEIAYLVRDRKKE